MSLSESGNAKNRNVTFIEKVDSRIVYNGNEQLYNSNNSVKMMVA